MIKDDDLITMLRRYRKLSSFGPNFLDEDVQSFWIKRFSKIPIHQIRVAVNELAGRPQFPTVSEVMEKIAELKAPDGEEVFRKLWNSLDRRNPPKNVNVVVARTIEVVGGWQNMCDVWLEATKDKHRREFLRAYREEIAKLAHSMAVGSSQIAIESTQDVGMGNASSGDPEWKKKANSEGEQKKIAMTSRDKNGGTLSDLIDSFKKSNSKPKPPKPRSSSLIPFPKVITRFIGGGNEHKTP